MPINFPYAKLKSGFEITRGVSTGDTTPVSKSPTPEDKRPEPTPSERENLISLSMLIGCIMNTSYIVHRFLAYVNIYMEHKLKPQTELHVDKKAHVSSLFQDNNSVV